MKKCLNCGKEVTNKYCGVTCQNEHKRVVNEAKYNLDPKLCACCNEPIEYAKRKNKFCNSSCSATKNNQGINRNSNASIYNSLSDDDFIKCVEKAST